MRKGGERCRGPYRRARDWCVHVITLDAGGESRTGYHYFATEEEGLRFKGRIEAELVRAATTITEALEEYEKHHKAKGNKPGSTKETLRRLRRFFPSHGIPLDLLTTRTCEGCYTALVGAGLASDSHRNYLAEAKTFLRTNGVPRVPSRQEGRE